MTEGMTQFMQTTNGIAVRLFAAQLMQLMQQLIPQRGICASPDWAVTHRHYQIELQT